MVRSAQELLAPTPIQRSNRLHQTRDIKKRFALLFRASLILATTAHAEGFCVGGSAGIGDVTLRSNNQFDDPDDKLFVVKGLGGY